MGRFRLWGGGQYSRPGLFGGFAFFPPVIKSLLLVNVVVWLLLDVLLRPFTYNGVPIFLVLSEYLMLWPVGTNFWPWQPITYMFLHGGFFHLLLNMFVLWMFGTELEHLWGSRKFLVYYLVCGLGAAAANLIVTPLIGQAAPTVGASGAVFGLLIAFGVMFPDRMIMIFPFFFPLRAKYFVAMYIGIELFFGVTGTTDGIAHFAHLGGAATGFLLLIIERRGVALPSFLMQRKRAEPVAQPSGYRYSRPAEGIREAKFYDIGSGRGTPDESEITQEMVDAILDKIGREGYQSLTEDEKRILNEASKKIN